MLKYVKNLLFIYKVLKIRLLAPGVNNRNKINNIFIYYNNKQFKPKNRYLFVVQKFIEFIVYFVYRIIMNWKSVLQAETKNCLHCFFCLQINANLMGYGYIFNMAYRSIRIFTKNCGLL